MFALAPTLQDVADARLELAESHDLRALRAVWRESRDPLSRADLVASVVERSLLRRAVYLSPEAVACVLDSADSPFAVELHRDGHPIGWLGPDDRLARHESDARAFPSEAAAHASRPDGHVVRGGDDGAILSRWTSDPSR